MNDHIIHIPVLIKEITSHLNSFEQGCLVDTTFGLGGYSKSFLENTKCNVLAFDRDPDVVKYAEDLSKKYKNRFSFKIGKFSNLLNLVQSQNVKKIVGIVFDLGLSNLQIFRASRGFSFKLKGPLDMRMSKSGETACEFINDVDEQYLVKILYEYGDEQHAKKIARKIVNERKKNNISNTYDLAELVRSAIPGKKFKIDKATKTFQAIRMYINQELNELQLGLIAAEKILSTGGILAVVSFHSKEDKIVKKFLQKCSGKSLFYRSKFFPQEKNTKKSFEIITKRPIRPPREEIQNNIKSRSAKLRVARRTNETAIHETAA